MTYRPNGWFYYSLNGGTEQIVMDTLKGAFYGSNLGGFRIIDFKPYNFESSTNKVTTISSSSTNDQYPSAKAVYDYLQSLNGNEEVY